MLGQLNNTITNMLKVIDTNLDTITEVSRAGNLKAKSFANALAFDEQIRTRLRSSNKYRELRAKNIMREELNKLAIDEVQDDEVQDDNNSSFDDLISEFEQNITF